MWLFFSPHFRYLQACLEQILNVVDNNLLVVAAIGISFLVGEVRGSLFSRRFLALASSSSTVILLGESGWCVCVCDGLMYKAHRQGCGVDIKTDPFRTLLLFIYLISSNFV